MGLSKMRFSPGRYAADIERCQELHGGGANTFDSCQPHFESEHATHTIPARFSNPIASM
jgi:hypothetical protein